MSLCRVMPFWCSALCALCLLFSLCSVAWASEPSELSPVTVGRYSVSWTPQHGLSVAVDSVPLIRTSTLYIVKAGWTGVLFDQQTVTPQITPWKTGSDGTTSATAILENENARCVYTFTLSHTSDVDTLDVALVYRLKNTIASEIEYAAGYLSGPVLAGGLASATVAEGPLPPRVITVAPPDPKRTQEQNRLSPPFHDLTLTTRLGNLQITYSGDAPLPVLFDARSDAQDWARDFPVFWLGIGSPSQSIPSGDGEHTARFRFALSPSPSAARKSPAVSGDTVARTVVTPEAFVTMPRSMPRVIPTPKEIQVAPEGRVMRLNAQTQIVRCDSSVATQNAVTLLQDAIRERTGVTLKIVTPTTPSVLKNALYVGIVGKSPLLSPSRVSVPKHKEGYAIALPYLAGQDEAGVLWAVQTAIQLLTADKTGAYLPAVTVRDWPTLAVRGVHLFHGQNALPFHKKLIDRVLSRFKLNTLLIQAEQMRWQHDPAVAPSWAGTPAQLQEEITFARTRGMTLYPLLQSYGHMEWLFNKAGNVAFAEDPETPYAVNFTNAEAVHYLEGFNAEADTVFGAPAFHIGLDEVTMRGRFPFRSAPQDFASLFVTAATHWHDFFRKRGKDTWMWADMALFPTDAAPDFGTAPSAKAAATVRERLPKDIVMLDWQYTGRAAYPSLKLLKDAGFKNVIAATWFNPENIQNFSRAAAQVGALGALQTTWCGYESKEDVLDTKERRQFEAMVLAAEYFWNGGAGPTPDKLPYDAAAVFADAWRETATGTQTARSGWFLRFAPIGTRPFADFVGAGPLNTLTALQPGKRRLADGTLYELSERPLLLYGKLNPSGDFPDTMTLPTLGSTETPARTVRLVLAASHQTDNHASLGRIVTTYNDGSTTTMPLVYGKNIASWDDVSNPPEAPLLWQGTTVSGQRAYLRQCDITAPVGKSIQSVTLVASGGATAPLLFAATVLE